MRLIRVSSMFAATAAALVLAAPSQALPYCGSAGQPTCIETPPPGVVLELSADENPHGLQPWADEPSGDQPLWPRVRGHEPYGFNAVSAGIDGTTLEDEAMLHQEVGASMARVPADWGTVQYYPNRNNGGPAWSYSHLDRQYRAYVRRGIRPLFTILKTPRRFTIHADTARNSKVMGCGTSDACQNPPTAQHLDKLALFAADLATRYPLAAGIEVWNEPNLSNPFWGGQPIDPEHYARMLEAAHDAIKSVRPSARVLGGAVAPFTDSYFDTSGSERMQGREFIRRMLQAGAAPEMDALSYHPYLGAYSRKATLAQQDASMFQRIIDQDNAVLGAYSDAGVPMDDRVVATEFGASTTEGYTEERQAAWLRLRYWAWDTDSPMMPPLPVDGAFIHKAVEESDPPYGFVHKSGFGLVRVKDEQGRFATKQAYCAFRTEFGGFPDCPAYLQSPGL